MLRHNASGQHQPRLDGGRAVSVSAYQEPAWSRNSAARSRAARAWASSARCSAAFGIAISLAVPMDKMAEPRDQAM
jgi:hypothetical protein